MPRRVSLSHFYLIQNRTDFSVPVQSNSHAKHCNRQRKALQSSTQSFASANAKLCIRQRKALPSFRSPIPMFKILLCNSLPNIYLTLNILTSIIWIVVLFNIVSIKGNCAEQRLFENNGYVNRGKLAFAYHFSLSKIYRHQVCLGYSQQPLGRNSTSQINTMRSTICKYLCLLPSKVASCHR